MTPQKLTIEDFVEGDTWPGIPAITILITPEGGASAPPESELASVIMRWRKINPATAAPDLTVSEVDLTSAAAKITITSAANWEISIPPQIVAGLTTGKWTWQLVFTAADATVQTYLQGPCNVLDKL